MFCGTVFVACNNSSSTKTTQNDTPQEKKNNRINGTVKYYYSGGELKSIVHYKDSLKTGISHTFYPSGQKQYEIPYKDGMKEGIVKWFYKSGQIYRETPYKRGKKCGIRKCYWESGALKAEVPLKNDMLGTGLKEFTQSGKLKKIPNIVVEKVVKSSQKGEYVLKFRLSDQSSRVDYYVGKLVEGKYLPKGFHKELRPVQSASGVGTFSFSVPKGSFLHKSITIVADKKTAYSNHLIITKDYTVSVRNVDN